MKYLSCQQCREADRIAIEELGVPSLNLMENAGSGCAEALFNLKSDGGVIVLCGSGNNGGDGLVIARHLHLKGETVAAILLAKPEKLSADSLTNLKRLSENNGTVFKLPKGAAREQIDELLASVKGTPTGVVIDAMLGTGATGTLRSPYDRIVEIVNAMDVTRVAVDLPTGLDGDTGEVVEEAFQADVTYSFIAGKNGMNTETGRRHCGKVTLIDIGLPQEAIARVSG